MRTIAIVNQKGGVGKTTSTINIGAGLVAMGKTVLLVDLDPQANLSYSLGIDTTGQSTIHEVIKGDIDPLQVIVKKNGYDVIPANINLSGAEIALSGVAGREFLLREAIGNISKNYDYVLLDCPPSLGLLTLNGLTTAGEIFIPLQTEYLALQGISQLLQTISVVKQRLNNTLEITGIVATMYDSRKILNREVVEKITAHFPEQFFTTLIRSNVALAEAPSYSQDIFTYKADSHGATDYKALCKEIVKREGGHD